MLHARRCCQHDQVTCGNMQLQQILRLAACDDPQHAEQRYRSSDPLPPYNRRRKEGSADEQRDDRTRSTDQRRTHRGRGLQRQILQRVVAADSEQAGPGEKRKCARESPRGGAIPTLPRTVRSARTPASSARMTTRAAETRPPSARASTALPAQNSGGATSSAVVDSGKRAECQCGLKNRSRRESLRCPPLRTHHRLRRSVRPRRQSQPSVVPPA